MIERAPDVDAAMITRFAAENYRCLRSVSQSLQEFQVLVGPNASGKSTFLDGLAFLGRFVSDGLDAAIDERTSNFYDLIWGRRGGSFRLSVEAEWPREPHVDGHAKRWERIRYAVEFGLDDADQRFRVLDEQIALTQSSDPWPIAGSMQLGDFPLISRPASDLYHVLPERPVVPWDDGEDVPHDDWESVRPTSQFSVLARLDAQGWPASTWLQHLLARRLVRVELASSKLRAPSPPGKGSVVMGDGSNLPWAVKSLQEHSESWFESWLAHLRIALPDLEGLRVIERLEDKHRYFVLQYRGGLEVPSWMVSEGTLRMIALTLLAYQNASDQICLIEEPETGIHPMNVDLVVQSLHSLYDGQALIATQSPAVLAAVAPKDVLVFSRDSNDGTTVVRGDKHPALQEWKGQPELGLLFASGVLT